MKFCKIQDTLNRCSSFLDVACIALDNEHFFPEGNTVSLLLEDVNNRINSSPGNKDQNISLYLHVHFPSSSTGTYCQQ